MNKKEKFSNNWKEVELKEIIKVQSGFAFKSKKFLSEGIPIVRISNFNNSYINLSNSVYYSKDFNVEKNKNYFLEENDILIAMSGATTGKLGFVKKEHLPCLLNQRIGKFKILNESFLDIKYLKFYLKSSLFQDFILKKAFGCAQPNLATKDIETFKIPIPYRDNKPDLEEQERIVKKLQLAEKLKENRKKADELTKEYLNSVFLDMFGDPRINPKGWEVKTWLDVLEIRNGKDQKTVKNNNGKFPVYGSGGLMEYTTDYLSPKNSIIIGRKGSINNPILIKEKFWNVDTAFALISNEKYLNYYYLYYFCIQFNFLKLNRSTTLPSLTKMELLKIKIPIPPIQLQNQFAQIVEQVEQLKEYQNKSKEEIENLYNKLMQQAFKGDI